MTDKTKKFKKTTIASAIVTGIIIAGTATFLWQNDIWQNNAVPRNKTEFPRTSIRTATYFYDASFSLSVKNPQDASADISLRLPILCGQDSLQEIQDLIIDPSPQSTLADTFGNPIAIYDFPDIPPHGTVTVTQKAKITRIAFADFPDASIENPRAILTLPRKGLYSPTLLKETKLAIGKETKPLYRAIRIYDWIRTFNFQLRNKPADYDTMLKTRTLQCADAARLTCALSQTAGMRATLVAGIVHRPEDPTSTDLHSWCRIELPSCGSVHVDPTMGRFPEERNCRFAQLDGSSIILWKGPEEEVFTASFKAKGSGAADSSAAPNQDSTEKNYINNDEICSKDFFVQLKKITPMKTELAQFVPNAQDLTEESGASAQPQYPDTPEQLIKYIEDNPEDLAAGIIAAQMEISEQKANLIRTLPKSPAANLFKALKAIKDNCWSDADLLLSGDSAAPEVQFGRLILYAQTKQPLRALKAGREALKSRNREIRQSAFDTILQIYFDLGDWYSAYEAASLAASQFPDPNFKMACARAAFKIGKDNEALQIAEEFSKNYPGDGYAWAALGVLYAERGDLNNALIHLNKALALNLEPQEHEYYVNLAVNIKKAMASVNAQQEK
ncbi:MAG: hypothetical protein K6G50_12785 [bacterium]|nr:hypothetical protein [bacterium]